MSVSVLHPQFRQSNVSVVRSQGVVVVTVARGVAGIGLPEGGEPGQILVKSGENDYITGWVNPPSGTGGVATWGLLEGDLTDQTDLVAELDSKADATHTHAIADTTGLQAALDAKAASAHTHTIANTTGLQAALDAKAAATHTHATADVTGLDTALAGKAATSHSHAISDTTGLQTALDAKAASSHTHSIANVTNLQTELDGKAASTHTHAQSDITGLTSALAGKASTSHTHVIADTTGLQAALDAKQASGSYATLDGGGKIPTNQLPGIAITTTTVVDDEAEMLALTAQEGDVAVNLELNRTFIHLGTTTGTTADWQEILAPIGGGGGVTTVNGRSGAVTLTATDVSLGNVNNTSDANKPVSTATQTALDGKASTSHNHDATYAAISHGHATSEITGLDTALAGKASTTHDHDADYAAITHDHDADYAPISHTHAISDTTGLQAALDGKAASSHSHTIANVTGLQTALDDLDTAIDGKASTTHDHDADYAPISHTHTTADITDFAYEMATKADATHSHAIADVTDLQSELDGKEPVITGSDTTTYWRGDKSFQTLNKAAVGLANVDNTTDANKPISSATQTALDAKLATTSYIKGVSTFCSGKPSASEVIGGSVAPYAFTATTGNSAAKASVAATASTVITIKVNGSTTVGTATFAASGTTATMSITSGSISAGDLVTFHAPASADATLANIAVTLR